jgi:hypothetical protein
MLCDNYLIGLVLTSVLNMNRACEKPIQASEKLASNTSFSMNEYNSQTGLNLPKSRELKNTIKM